MDKKQQTWNEMKKLEFEINNQLENLEKTKDNYKEELVKETVNDMMKILKEEGTLTERDFQIHLGNLAIDIKRLYLR